MSLNRSIFEKATKHNREWGCALLDGLELTGSERILDLGCGDGACSRLLAGRVPRGSVTAVSFSQPELGMEPPEGPENLRFVPMDPYSLSFPGEFDLIFSHGILHWVLDHRQLLSRLRGLLRAGGRICWEFGAAGNCDALRRTLLQTMDDPEYREYFKGFEWPWYMPAAEEYRRLLAEAGFTGIRAEEAAFRGLFESPEEVLAWLDMLSLLPFRDALPEHLRESFRDDVAVGVISRCRKPGGIYEERFRRLRVMAVK